MPRGIFISFEGSEGCGKSTQIDLLRRALQESSRAVHVTREPGGTTLSEAIRHLLKHSKEGEAMTPEAELLLFTASRAQLVREKLLPALAEGTVILADRYFDSTTVYQGLARQLPLEKVETINRFAVGQCIPDLTFVLDLESAVARQRMMRRARPVGQRDRMEEEPIEFYETVRQGYLELARREPERFVVVDGEQAPEVVQQTIRQTLEERFHGLFRS